MNIVATSTAPRMTDAIARAQARVRADLIDLGYQRAIHDLEAMARAKAKAGRLDSASALLASANALQSKAVGA